VKCGIGKPRVNTSPVRVLCLDGGGIRGLATIVMLRVIMERAQVWCVGEVFDLVVGTSTGGVIALGAGLLRLTLDEVGDLYDTMASEVFKPV
jgi:patatin-like phospholipase/acyl hydrolase